MLMTTPCQPPLTTSLPFPSLLLYDRNISKDTWLREKSTPAPCELRMNNDNFVGGGDATNGENEIANHLDNSSERNSKPYGTTKGKVSKMISTEEGTHLR